MARAYEERSATAAAWIVVNTHPHREHVAIENLERQQFEAYCPMIAKRRTHARRSDAVLRPLFPGYLFVQASRRPLRWRPILSTYGVRQVARTGDEPSFIDNEFIESLKAREIDGAIVRPAAPYLVGQRVCITTGPFDGLVATIIDMDEKDRLLVLLNFMSRRVRMRVPSEHVAPA
jgi:transcriptional antiterminator RfaH